MSQTPNQPRRIGVFGGTFDPPHVGHLVVAMNVLHELALDEVLLMVANDPWQKRGTRKISLAADRFALVDAAVRDIDGLSASTIEMELGGASYTADTLEKLLSEDDHVELFTILGADAANGLLTWERHERVAELSTLVVVDRPGVASELPTPAFGQWRRVEVPHLDVSSSDLRERVRDGRPLDFLVTTPVLEEIAQRSMYSEGER
jgi:nicotinate-nucleotide adenylyltransferase